MENNQLAVYQNFDNISKAANALQKSGYFKDVTSEAQAIVKVMAGAELGLPPFASMTGIHIIQGKPALGSNVIATLIDNDPRYDYKIKKHDAKECIIDFYRNGELHGTSTFTMDEANTAGLTNNPSWKKFPSDMLFARAITRGARRFAPGIFGGSPIYTPEELGADVDEDGYIDTTHTIITEPEPSLVDTAVELGGTVKNTLTVETDESHDWESMTTGELAGRLNEYTKRLKANPKDEDTLNKFNEAKFWLEKKNEK